jgi:hypothetical protein
MALQELTHATCLSPGADLWVVPPMDQSQQTQKIDWYLNFQIAKFSLHQRPALPPRVKEIVKLCDLDEQTKALPASSDLLILSSQTLPNRWVLLASGSEDLPTWTQKIFAHWSDMNKPTLRIFLPESVAKNDFEKIWKKLDDSSTAPKVSVVVEG